MNVGSNTIISAGTNAHYSPAKCHVAFLPAVKRSTPLGNTWMRSSVAMAMPAILTTVRWLMMRYECVSDERRSHIHSVYTGQPSRMSEIHKCLNAIIKLTVGSRAAANVC